MLKYWAHGVSDHLLTLEASDADVIEGIDNSKRFNAAAAFGDMLGLGPNGGRVDEVGDARNDGGSDLT